MGERTFQKAQPFAFTGIPVVQDDPDDTNDKREGQQCYKKREYNVFKEVVNVDRLIEHHVNLIRIQIKIAVFSQAGVGEVYIGNHFFHRDGLRENGRQQCGRCQKISVVFHYGDVFVFLFDVLNGLKSCGEMNYFVSLRNKYSKHTHNSCKHSATISEL